MPTRALGYVTSALEVGREYLPNAQVQFVSTLHTGQRINGLRACDSAISSGQFRRYGKAIMRRLYPEMEERTTFLVDSYEIPSFDEEHIAGALATTSQSTQDRLASAAKHRKGIDTKLAYVAAHLHMHDTAALLHTSYREDPDPIVPDAIVSLGAQSERPFYEARMACREQGVAIPGMVGETGQLFTKHVLPPYFQCRTQYEGGMSDPEQITTEPPSQHPVASVVRDLSYLRDVLLDGAEHA